MKTNSKIMFNRLHYFGELEESVKTKIFKVCCTNNLRYLKHLNKRQKMISRMIYKIRTLKEDKYLNRILKDIDVNLLNITFAEKNWIEKILQTEKFLSNEIGLNKWESSFILNILLARNNLCPLLRYAFDRWHDISNNNKQQQIFYLSEFSTMYLYRLARIKNKNKVNAQYVYLTDGAHNSLFLSEKPRRIKKMPISMAAKYFINDQEIRTTKLLSKSIVKEYIPHLISYNKNKKIIIRQYIKGETGHKLLMSNFFKKNTEAVKDLKRFFRLYKKTRKKLKINLDIHPGNFIWSSEKQKWFFVDTGPIPFIGSEYFPLDSFNNYFQKIWTERHQRIKKIPIRSVYLKFF